MSQQPEILSVIIATRNRASDLRDVLEHVSHQDTDDRFTYEVIVVDNGSTDTTKTVVDALSASYPVPLRYLFEGQRGKGYALNAALRIATGTIIAFTDDDTVMGPTWLMTLYHTFDEHAADGVGGPVRPQWIGERPSWLGDRLLRQLGMVDHGPTLCVMSSIDATFIGPNCAYRASLFAEYGPYSTEPGCMEDADWFRRLFCAGRRLIYQPEAGVLHKIDGRHLTPQRIRQRFFRHGRSCVVGLQRQRQGKVLCRIPLWIVRVFLELHLKALGCWVRGNRREALYYWLQRYTYWGMITGCFRNWLARTPVTPAARPARSMEWVG